MLSSVLTSLEDLFDPFLSLCRGGGEELLGGVADRRDFLELRDGVRYGVSAGVGSDIMAGVLHSSSVSHTAMMREALREERAKKTKVSPGFHSSEDSQRSHIIFPAVYTLLRMSLQILQVVNAGSCERDQSSSKLLR